MMANVAEGNSGFIPELFGSRWWVSQGVWSELLVVVIRGSEFWVICGATRKPNRVTLCDAYIF